MCQPSTSRTSGLSFLVLVAAAAASGALAQDKPAPDRIVRSFDIGSGPQAMGRPHGGEGTDMDGPQAIYVGRNGEIFVLDQVNSRVVSFDGKDSLGPTRSLTLPDGLEPTDMIATDNGLIVWDGKPISLDVSGDGLTRSLAISRDTSVGSDETVLSMFGLTGSVDVGSDVEAMASATRSVGSANIPVPNGTVRKSVGTHGAGPVTAVFTPDAKRTSMDIVITSRTSQARLAQLKVMSREQVQLGAVELLDIDTLGRLYVQVETIPNGQRKQAQIFVARFAQNSNFEGAYELPLNAEVGLARRFVTVSPDGEVYFLRTRTGRVEVLGVGFSPAAAVSETSIPKSKGKGKSKGKSESTRAEAVPAMLPMRMVSLSTGADGAVPIIPGRLTPIAAVGPLSRQRVVETAFGFEGIRWRATPSTYGADPDMRCSGFDRIRRPGYIRGQLGKEVRGVPYCWGCMNSLPQFASKISKGALAGNVCTRDAPKREIAGVDCSSFVSAAWGLSVHFTTAMIPTIAAPIADPWTMKPGDVFNKPHSHVMMFLGFTADRKVHVIEASPGACNGRVCRNVYPMASLLARGYTARRFRGLAADGTERIAIAPLPAGKSGSTANLDAAPGNAGTGRQPAAKGAKAKRQ